MAGTTLHKLGRAAWALARRRHGVIARRQLVDLGASRAWIEHRIARGRLFRVHRGVYAVGRRELTRKGRLMAAVLRCGAGATLSHRSAAVLWRILERWRGPIDVSLGAAVSRRPSGIAVHRTRTLTDQDVITHEGIPVTTPARTLIDLATVLGPNQLEAAVNEADALGLIDPETLRAELAQRKGQPGIPAPVPCSTATPTG